MESGKNTKLALGHKGEDIACELLCSMGHTILERNYRCGHLEVDIISYDADGIHFVEVKTRCESIQAPPQESVGIKKQKRIVAAAKMFLKSGKGKPFGNHECMFDIVAVTFTGDRCSTEWFPQAYIPIYT